MGRLVTWLRRNRRRWALTASLAVLAMGLGVEAHSDPLDPYLGDPGVTLPNLVPDVDFVAVTTERDVTDATLSTTTEHGEFLAFNTLSQNLGSVPIQVTIDQVQSPQTSTVSQCVSWRSAEAHVCRETEQVGGYQWHDAHTHFHYTDFATYELRRLAPDGRPDYSASGLLQLSGKVSFCFLDSDAVRDDAPPPFYTTATCNAPVVMGISPGWADIYDAGLEGQSLPIEGLPNGDYALITHLNYEQTLHETGYDDNYVEVIVRLSTNPDFPQFRQAQILRRFWPAPNDRGTVTTTTSSTTTTQPKHKKPKKHQD